MINHSESKIDIDYDIYFLHQIMYTRFDPQSTYKG